MLAKAVRCTSRAGTAASRALHSSAVCGAAPSGVRSPATVHSPGEGSMRLVTVLPGHGVGPS
jgi:hypothetical protein